jgi:hypothetical protein
MTTYVKWYQSVNERSLVRAISIRRTPNETRNATNAARVWANEAGCTSSGDCGEEDSMVATPMTGRGILVAARSPQAPDRLLRTTAMHVEMPAPDA